MRRLHFILLLALVGTARSEPQATDTSIQSREPVLPTQTARATPRSTNDEQRIVLGMQMQKAVLATQDLKEIKRLLKAGFKIDDPIGCGTFNCVDGAVETHNLELLKFFLDSGAKPKGSALFQAAWCKDEATSYKMIQMLLKAGADANYKDHLGLTPLGSASYLGHWSVAELFIIQPGMDLNYLDTDHRTPLMYAAQKGNVKIVRLLLEKGADPGIAGPPDPNHGLYEIPRGKTAADYTRNKEIRNLLASYARPPTTTTASAPVTH